MTEIASTAYPHARRNLSLLAATQGLSMTGAALVVTVTALAGQYLAPDPAWATFPLASQFVGTVAMTIPASLLMGRIGRKAGFLIGQVIGVISALICVWGLYEDSFAIFMIGSMGLGLHNAFWAYLRFAAAEAVEEGSRARAISYVMAAGIVAAIFGPRLGAEGMELLAPVLFAGSYALIAALAGASILLLQFVRIGKPARKANSGSGRPLREIIRQRQFIVAVLAGMTGYGTMAFVMTATPLAMQFCGFGIGDTASIISWHALGMFAPGFITGRLIERFGVRKIILTGVMLNLVCMAASLSGVTFGNFFIGLVALGVGWNFMFVGATRLLTRCHTPEEASKVQAINDFCVFGFVAVASLSAGALQNAFGWDVVNLVILAPMAVVTLALLVFVPKPTTAAAE